MYRPLGHNTGQQRAEQDGKSDKFEHGGEGGENVEGLKKTVEIVEGLKG